MTLKLLVLVERGEGCFSLQLGCERKELLGEKSGALSSGPRHSELLAVGHPQ